MTASPPPEPAALALLQVLMEAVMFPLSRIALDLTDDELHWSPVPDSKDVGWTPTGHDPRTDPFTTIGWRWEHFTQELHAISTSSSCLGAAGKDDREVAIIDAESAVRELVDGVRAAASAIAGASDERLCELTDSEFGTNTRRHWVALFLVEAVHHAAEIGVLRDLYRHHSQELDGSARPVPDG